jgi:acetolactate synthase-1/2/3 large subunit
MTEQELVVLLPAVGGDATCWAPQRAALEGRYRVLALDFRRAADEVSIAGYADDVARAIEAAGYARAHLVGLSLGGVVALETFRRHPTHVRSLALANTWAWQPEGEGRWSWFSEMFDRLGLPEFSLATLGGLFASTTDPAVVAHVRAVESAKDPAAYRATWKAMLHADLRPALAALDVPTLLIGGRLDPVTPTDPLLTTIRASAPAARLVELPTASHFSNLDAPEAFNRALLPHLRRARSRAGDRLADDEEPATDLPEGSTAEQLLRLLSARGVELFASNSGTDFTPIIDALANLGDEPDFRLRVVPAPHENTAVAMAHGHALVSRRPQAAMAHVTVGTANMGLGLINARRAHVPLLLLSGRTPLHEEGMPGVRTNFVQWGQESFDQAAMFREYTKWDYELRGPHGLDMLVDRALAIAASEPAGPVYLTLPREPLCAPAPARKIAATPRQVPSVPGASPEALLRAAETWLGRSKKPLIITADLGRHAGGPEALLAFARATGAGIIEHGKRNFFNAPTEEPHHLGFEPLPALEEADLVIAVECPVPWIPAFAKLANPPPCIQIGIDPLHSDLPARGFPVDLGLAGDPVATLRALTRRVLAAGAPRPLAWPGEHEARFGAARREAADDAARPVITKRYLSHTLGAALDDDTIVVNEYNLDPWLVVRNGADSWFENSVASGLGWSLGAALGIKLAAPEQTVVVTLGDGSYLFNTPLSAHFTAMAEALPMLIVVFDDQAWSTIKKSTKGAHPQGHSARTGRYALCDFPVGIAYDQVAAACGAVGLRAETPAELPARIAEALRLVRDERRLVLLNVICERDG